MLDTPKGKTMATPEAVDNGVEIFAFLEDRADECVEKALGFNAVFETIRDDGHISNAECKALKLEAKMIVLNFKAALHIFHVKTTQRAQLKGIDIPQTRDGGPR